MAELASSMDLLLRRFVAAARLRAAGAAMLAALSLAIPTANGQDYAPYAAPGESSPQRLPPTTDEFQQSRELPLTESSTLTRQSPRVSDPRLQFYPDDSNPYYAEEQYSEEQYPTYETPGPLTSELQLRDEAGTGMSGMAGPGGGNRSPFSATAFWIPESNIKGANDNLSVHGEGFQLAFPVQMSEGRFTLLTTRVNSTSINTTADLPGSPGTEFPEQLWNINVGLMHVRTLENGWSAGGLVSVGSASDQPFASIDEMNANLLAFLKVPVRERDAWNFAVMYSPLGQLNFPVPGISYSWNPSPQFSMNIGIPFSLRYQPDAWWTYEFSYLPITNVNATVRRKLTESWSLYGTFQTHNEGYQLADRTDDEERLYEFDQRLLIGSRWNIAPTWVVDLSAGYLFSRSYFVGDSFFDDDNPSLDVADAAMLQLRLEWLPKFGRQ